MFPGGEKILIRERNGIEEKEVVFRGMKQIGDESFMEAIETKEKKWRNRVLYPVKELVYAKGEWEPHFLPTVEQINEMLSGEQEKGETNEVLGFGDGIQLRFRGAMETSHYEFQWMEKIGSEIFFRLQEFYDSATRTTFISLRDIEYIEREEFEPAEEKNDAETAAAAAK